MEPICTPRLRLIPATAASVRAEIEDRDEFFNLLCAKQAEDWPSRDLQAALPFFLARLERSPEEVGWLGWYWVLMSEHTLVGSGGFKGPPDSDGTVEIGYETRTPHRRRGYATEAVGALVDWAFLHEDVNRVVAETREDNRTSLRLLRKLGFKYAGPGSETDRFRLERRRSNR